MARTLDEVIQGFSQMSNVLGLGQTPSSAGFGVQTPFNVPGAMPTPAQASAAIASGMYPPTSPAAMGGAGAGPSPQSMAAGIIPPFNTTAAGASNIPYQAAMMMGAMPGGPAMQFMTPSQYGVFRTPMATAQPTGFEGIPGVNLPMPPLPGAAMFTPPADFAMQHEMMAQRQIMAAQLAGQNAAVHLGIGAAGMGLGGMLGAAGGAMLGGGFGARLGGLAGAGIGLMAGGSGLSNILANGMMNIPAHNAAHVLRVQEMSGFITGAGASSPTGVGLSLGGSQQIVNNLGRISGEMGGAFNRQDILNIMQGGAQQGLFDFARNSDQIIETLRTTVKAVSAIAKLTGDPDIRHGIKLIADMQRMGFTAGETGTAMVNAQAMSRLAGVSPGQLFQTHGLQGAAIFQGAGLLGASGAMAGMTNAGLAASAAQTSAFSPAFMALMGGKEGLAQSMTQGNAAFMAGPGKMILASMLKHGKNGFTFGQDPLSLITGNMDINKIVGAASSNLGSVQALQDFNEQSPELQAQMMARLQQANPMALQMMQFRYIKSLQKQLGPNISFATAAQSAGLDQNSAISLQKMFTHDNFENIAKQMRIADIQQRHMQGQREDELPGLFGRAYINFKNDAFAAVGGDMFETRAYKDQIAAEKMEGKRLAAAGLEDINEGSSITSDMALSAARHGFFGTTASRSRATAMGFGSGFQFMNKIRKNQAMLGGDELSVDLARSGGGLTGLASRANLFDLVTLGSMSGATLGARSLLGGAAGSLGADSGSFSGVGIGNMVSAAFGVDVEKKNATTLAALNRSRAIVEKVSDMSDKEALGNINDLSKRFGQDTTRKAMRAAREFVERQAATPEMLRDSNTFEHGLREAVANSLSPEEKNRLDPAAMEQLVQSALHPIRNSAEFQAVSKGVRSAAGVANRDNSISQRLRSARTDRDMLEGSVENYMDHGISGALRKLIRIDTFGLVGGRDQEARGSASLYKKFLEVSSNPEEAKTMMRYRIIDEAANNKRPGAARMREAILADHHKNELFITARKVTLNNAEAEAVTQMAAGFDGSSSVEEATKSLDDVIKQASEGVGNRAADAVINGMSKTIGLNISGDNPQERALSLAKALQAAPKSNKAITDDMRKAAANFLKNPNDDTAYNQFMQSGSLYMDTSELTKDEAKKGVGPTSGFKAMMGALTGMFSDSSDSVARNKDFAKSMESFSDASSNLVEGSKYFKDMMERAAGAKIQISVTDEARDAAATSQTVKGDAT